MTELETLIIESKMKGVWAGYIRQNYGEDVFNDLLQNKNCVKIKSMNCLHSSNAGVPMWAIVKKGFDRSLLQGRSR